MKSILVLLVLAFGFACGAPASLAEQSSPRAPAMKIPVTGNSRAFKIDRKGAAAIQLASCNVVEFYADRTAWDVPEQYVNRETLQQLFDEILAGELVVFSKAEERAMAESKLDPYAYAGVMLICESPKGSNLYTGGGTGSQAPGQGYAYLSLIPTHAPAVGRDHLVYVEFHALTRQGKSGGYIHVQSEALYDLIMQMSRQDYALDDLRNAESIRIDDNFALPSFAARDGQQGVPPTAITDRDAVAQLAELLCAGEKLGEHIKVYGHQQLRFAMPDGATLSAYIVLREGLYVSDIREQPEGNVLLMTGDALYTVDPHALKEAFAAAGVPEIYW